MFFENLSKYQITNARLTLLEERLFITLKEPCQNVSQYSRNVAFLQWCRQWMLSGLLVNPVTWRHTYIRVRTHIHVRSVLKVCSIWLQQKTPSLPPSLFLLSSTSPGLSKQAGLIPTIRGCSVKTCGRGPKANRAGEQRAAQPAHQWQSRGARLA